MSIPESPTSKYELLLDKFDRKNIEAREKEIAEVFFLLATSLAGGSLGALEEEELRLCLNKLLEAQTSAILASRLSARSKQER